jgi:putative transposase
VSDRFEFIDAEYATSTTNTEEIPSVAKMCDWLEVSRSGFYEWRSRPLSATARRREDLKLLITKSFEDGCGSDAGRPWGMIRRCGRA